MGHVFRRSNIPKQASSYSALMPCAQQLDQCRAVKTIVESVDGVVKEGNKQRLQNDAHVRGKEEPDGYLVLKARKALVDEH